jgi:hypothetical protein
VYHGAGELVEADHPAQRGVERVSLTTVVTVMSSVDVEHLLTNRWPGGFGIGPRLGTGSMSRLLWGALGAVGSSDQLQGSQYRDHPQNLTARAERRSEWGGGKLAGADKSKGSGPGPSVLFRLSHLSFPRPIRCAFPRDRLSSGDDIGRL